MPVRSIEGMKEWKEKRAEYHRLWCKLNRQRAQEINKKGSDKWRLEKHEDYLYSKRRNRENIRQKIRDFFGNKCGRCGNSDFRVLQVDHINGDGYKYRTKKSGGIFGKYYSTSTGLWSVWKLIRTDPEKAKKERQLLCANCNWIKRYENKEFR